MPEGGDYQIGVSSGWFGIAKTPELLGLAQKAASIATYGVNYVQVDFENTSEFFEPEVIERLRQVVDDLQIKWGAHGEIGQSMSWETPIEAIWKQSHMRLHQYLDGLYDFFIKGRGQRKGVDYSKYVPEYINFHASNMPPIGLFIEQFRYSGHVMMDFEGRISWEHLLEENNDLMDWFLENMIPRLYARSAAVLMTEDRMIIEQINEIIRENISKDENYLGIGDEKDPAKVSEAMQAKQNELYELYKTDKSMRREVQMKLYHGWLEVSKLRNYRGSIEVEEWAYLLVAKYLEFKRNDSKEPLWNLFIGNKSMEDLEREYGMKFFDAEKGLVKLIPDIVAMVASRYIIGHFDVPIFPEYLQERKARLRREGSDDADDDFYKKTAREKLNIVKVVFSFETPEIIEQQREGLQRIIRAKHIYQLVKAFNHKYIKGLFDSEHYIHNGFDPLDEIRSCPEDMGKHFIGFHVGAPKPYHPVHEPIDVGSEAQRWIYIYAYELRKRGFGIDGNRGLIIFERGGARGGQSPVNFLAQSATALRLVVEELKKDTPPTSLPVSFFGVSPEGMHSMEKQRAMMKEHYWDPLKGTLAMPEEDHTFLGRAALEKGKKPDEWKKEELR